MPVVKCPADVRANWRNEWRVIYDSYNTVSLRKCQSAIEYEPVVCPILQATSLLSIAVSHHGNTRSSKITICVGWARARHVSPRSRECIFPKLFASDS